MWVYSCLDDPGLHSGVCPNPQWVEWQSLLMQSMDFSGMGITHENILYVFTWGLGAVLSLWAIGYAVGVAFRVIRKA